MHLSCPERTESPRAHLCRKTKKGPRGLPKIRNGVGTIQACLALREGQRPSEAVLHVLRAQEDRLLSPIQGKYNMHNCFQAAKYLIYKLPGCLFDMEETFHCSHPTRIRRQTGVGKVERRSRRSHARSRHPVLRRVTLRFVKRG